MNRPVRSSEKSEPSAPLVAILADILNSALDWESSHEFESPGGDLGGVRCARVTRGKRSEKKRELGEEEHG